jgi:hypothetical protein
LRERTLTIEGTTWVKTSFLAYIRDSLKSSSKDLVERDHFTIEAFRVRGGFLRAAESHESMGTKVCDVHHLRRLPPGLPPVGLLRGLHSLQDQTLCNLWGGYVLFPSEEINAGCSALLICSRASRNVRHRQGIPYRADGEDRLDAVVDVRIGERDLLYNHWA